MRQQTGEKKISKSLAEGGPRPNFLNFFFLLFVIPFCIYNQLIICLNYFDIHIFFLNLTGFVPSEQGSPRPHEMTLGISLSHLLSMYICPKTNQNKEKSSLVNPYTDKATWVDLRVLRSRVSPEKDHQIVRSRVSQEKDHRSIGIDGKLACVHTICVQV